MRIRWLGRSRGLNTGRRSLLDTELRFRPNGARENKVKKKGINLTHRQSCLLRVITKESDMSDDQLLKSRRNALKCMAFGGAGTLFALSGGVFTPMSLASARGYDESKEG